MTMAMDATTVHSRPVVASLYSRNSSTAPNSSPSSRSGAPSGNSSQPHRSHPFSSISLSPDSTYGVAAGKDVLHVLRLRLDNNNNARLNRLEEIRSVRISQVRFVVCLHAKSSNHAYSQIMTNPFSLSAFPITTPDNYRCRRSSKPAISAFA